MMVSGYIATGVVSAGSDDLVCICARFFSVFFWFWVCVDLDSTKSRVQSPPADISMENDGCPQITVQTTLALIKPDAIDQSEEIEDIILRSGFSVLRVSLLSGCSRTRRRSSN